MKTPRPSGKQPQRRTPAQGKPDALLAAFKKDERVASLLAAEDLDGFETYADSAFFEAIRKADCWRDATKSNRSSKRGDLNRLVELLRLALVNSPAGVTPSRAECELLIDLLSRHELRQKAGGRKTPVYKRSSWAELKLEIAADSVRYYQRKGLSFDAAVERVARDNYVPAPSLRSYLRGKLHPDR